jgi:uncharacterized iron-regulated membrane protein
VNIRQLHAYIGLFIAPSVLFFALTGALQLFSLHEAHGSYTPPPLIEKLSSIHKDQVFAASHHHDHAAPPSAAKKAAPKHDDDDDKGPSLGTTLLKWFFLVVALSLVTTTCFGLWIGLTHLRYKRVGWFLLAAGAVIPIVLLLI